MATPEEEELFRARMGLIPRTAQTIASANPAAAMGLALGSMAPQTRDTTSFMREDPSTVAPPTILRPVEPGYTADAPTAPTLDPNYGQRRAPGMLAGSGAGGISRAAWDASRQKLVDDFDQDKHLQYVQGANRADEIAGRSRLQVEEAAIKQRHAELQQEADAEAATKHEAFLKRNQELADDIGRKSTSVESIVGDAVGDIGMVFGGMLMARAGHLDQAMAQFNKRMDDSLKRQQLELENKKVKLQARQSVFGQMMQESGDRRMAALQTRNLMLESAKQRLTADADRLGIPSAKTNAEILVNKIQHDQDAVIEQIEKESYQTKRAEAAAAASARAAAEEKAYRRSMDERRMRVDEFKADTDRMEAQGKSGTSADKDNARFVATGQDASGAPTGYLARNESEAGKAEAKRVANQKLIDLIDEAEKIRNEQGTGGRLASAVNPLKPLGYKPEWETKLKVLQGKMTGAIKEAESLGTLDAGSQAFSDKLTGGEGITGVGGTADDTLKAFRETLVKGQQTDASGAAGTRAARIVDPQTGRERIVIIGGPNAPKAEMPGSVTRK